MDNLTVVNGNDTVGVSSVSKEVITWIVIDSIIIFLTLAGNILTICAIKLSRKISELLSNRYIFSLAVSDLLVGLTIPYHMAFTISNKLGSYKTTCLLRFVLIILACSSSIYNLLAIAADRYIAIVLPFHYSRHMSRRFVWSIVFGGWALSILIATMPIYWNNYWTENMQCSLDKILPENYVRFIITPMFGSIWLAMSMLYFRIWREAAEHAKRLRSTTQLNQMHMKTLKENKSVQMVLTILGCFSLCWLPYFIIVTCMRFFDDKFAILYEAAFTMAVTNSCMNPLIYAWKNHNYRKAFWCLLKCKSPRTLDQDKNFITDHVPNKKKDSIVTQMEDGTKTIELNCSINSIKYDERENSDVTVTTCIDACSISKLTKKH